MIKIPGIHVQFLFIIASPVPRGEPLAIDKQVERLLGFSLVLVGRRCRGVVSYFHNRTLYFTASFIRELQSHPYSAPQHPEKEVDSEVGSPTWQAQGKKEASASCLDINRTQHHKQGMGAPV